MNVSYTVLFRRSFRALPSITQKKFEKQISHLLKDLRYPSLHAKKYDETKGIWQARVDNNIRFYFVIDKNIYILLNIIRHPD